MKVIYALDPIPKSIFLAGPTPRDEETPSPRPEALRILRDELNFDGTVLVPEKEGGGLHRDKNRQVHWEWEGLNHVTVIAFWVPRHLATLPGFTTNIEWGMFANSGKLILGYPEDAPKMLYLNSLAQRFNVPVVRSLRELLRRAVEKANEPFGGTFDASMPKFND